MKRREFLESAAVLGSSAALATVGCGSDEAVVPDSPPVRGIDEADIAALPLDASRYGRWRVNRGLPEFVYSANQDALPEAEWDPILFEPTRRHFHMLGNRSIQLQVANDGTVGLFDESEGLRWLVYADLNGGTGVSRLEDGDETWGSAFAERAANEVPERVFGPTYFRVRAEHGGLALERTLLCPEGETRWVLVRVELTLDAAEAARTVFHTEEWALRPRFVDLLPEEARDEAAARVSYSVADGPGRLVAVESFPSDAPGIFGTPAELVLEALGSNDASTAQQPGLHPTLQLRTEVRLEPGETQTLWFRFGRNEGDPGDPEALFEASLEALTERLPFARSSRGPEAALEIPWHAAALTGGASRDDVLGGHALDQASTYSFVIGFNGAARDPLQHALPLVYSEPDLALSVLENTCAWGSPDGDLPYGLDGKKERFDQLFRPSDMNLWALWLAAEYAFATGDLEAFERPARYHPSWNAPEVALRQHLTRQFRFFVDFVGRGARNHVRILNADWNDVAIEASGVPREDMIERGSSVLNSAMAAWVLPVFAALAEQWGDSATASEARDIASDLNSLVRDAWNGKWFHRAYAPDGAPIGDDDCWLEGQPWAILCGAANDEQARSLLRAIDEGHRSGSPLGSRVRWPSEGGLAALGGIWFSINMTLIWAAARVDPELAWDEWRRMTLTNHAVNYPEIWEGTLSGPDAFNGEESATPGRTWAAPGFAMQAFPVSNLHSHAQPILSYLRLLGVEPTERGTLAVGTGGSFSSPTFELREDGTGRLETTGDVRVEASTGTRGGRGLIEW